MQVQEGVGKEETIYRSRFTEREEGNREVTWKVLCRDFFQPYVSPNDCVVDIGAGDGLFLKNIRARRRIAVDLSPHVHDLSRVGIEVIERSATEFRPLLTEQPDVIFMSNFLEHLPAKKLVLDVFAECFSALKDGGVLMILQPNIRYVGVKYWDYIDHHIALTEESLREGLQVSGFEIIRLIPRFLPYTAKSLLGRFMTPDRCEDLVTLYLKNPLAWRFLGAQTFVLARKLPEKLA